MFPAKHCLEFGISEVGIGRGFPVPSGHFLSILVELVAGLPGHTQVPTNVC